MIKNTKIGGVITYLDVVDSTSNYVAKLINDCNIVHGQVIMSDFQGTGRGQRGSNWYSEPGMNLLFSVYLEFDNLSVNDQAWLLKYTAVSVFDVIESRGISAQIKWPNDILIRSKKVCGILIENQFVGSNIKSSTIGIGLNVNQVQFEQLEATSLRNELSQEQNRIHILEAILNHLNRNFDLLLFNKMELQKKYLSNLFQMGVQSTYYSSKIGEFQGTIIDVNNEGRLVIENYAGKLEFDLKEIQFIH